jgi:hypothetical protein
MDPLTVSAVAAVVNKFLGEAAAEAGKSAWSGLVRLVRSALPDRPAVAQAAEQLTPGTGSAPDQAVVIDLSHELVSLARTDAGFDAALREWLDRARSLSVSVEGGVTTNVISGSATVHGNVVQARDVGSISLG